MKQRIPIRILSLFLALVLLVPNFQPAFAGETVQVTEPVSVDEVPQETTFPELTETVVITEPVQETEPVETEVVETEPVETEPVETEPVETEPVETEPVETEPVETEPVETEPEEAPLFPGLPEDYVLSEEALARRDAMLASETLEALSTLTPGKDYVEDEILVYTTSEEDAAIVAAAFNGEVVSCFYNTAVVRLTDVTVLEAVDASLNHELRMPVASPNYCSYVEPVESTFSTPYSTVLPKEESWYSWVKENMTSPDPALTDPRGTTYQWMHDAVDTYAAWGVTTGDSWVKVAVIDTGVNANHEDLKGKVTSYDIGYGTNDGFGADNKDSHGTHVAGIIAATMNNGKGGAGIAPGVSIINIRVANSSGSMPADKIAQGIYKAVDAGAHIINMSLGGPMFSWTEQDAISYAVSRGVTVIAAMGNVGSNAMDYPAAYDGVIAVAATDASGSRAYFSNYGAWADVSAPGQNIYSTVYNGSYTNRYDSYQGTSMAAPVVAGVAALYTSAMGERVDPAAMEKALKASATKVAGATGMGAGIVSASKMLDDKPAAPFYVIKYNGQFYDGVEFCKSHKVLPCEASIFFTENPITFNDVSRGDDRDVIIYTFDGKNPSVKNGEIVNGVAIADSDEIGFKLEPYAGSSVTIKAARVSGMGMVGKTLSLNLKVAASSNVTGVTVNGPKEMVAGKSTTLTATVLPADTADQGVTWSISSYGTMYGAKIDAKTGKLTTPSGKSGKLTVRATSKVDTRKYGELEINVKHIDPVAKIVLSDTNAYGYAGDAYTITAKMYDTSGRLINTALAGVKWTSSNPKIVEVDQKGNVYCIAKGNATVTCMALDGSNKKATCKVQVRQAVEEITVTGQRTIQAGTSATFKATVGPKDAYAKKVTWRLSGNAPSGVTISSSGKVTVPSYVSNFKSFNVIATATDDIGLSVSYKVTVLPKCTGVYIGADKNADTGNAQGPSIGTQLSGNYYRVKSVDLFSIDLKASSGPDNQVKLKCFFSGHNHSDYFAYAWTSSNPSVATIDAAGNVVAYKAGTAKITAAALDGSNKKATVTVKVTNPASTISISTSAPRMLSNTPYLAFGKSATNKAVFSDTYGKPSNQKVNWRFSIYEIDGNGNTNRYNDNGELWTDYFKRKKLVTLSSGKLSVSKNVINEWAYIDGEFVVNVYATAADGSGAQGYIQYKLIPPTTFMQSVKKTYDLSPGEISSWSPSKDTFAYFYCDQWPNLGATFTATSSNPAVVSLYEDSSYPSVYCYDYDYSAPMGLYRVRLAAIKPGTAKITVKAADGSNKSCTFTVIVK